MLSSNTSHYTGPAADQSSEPYVALRVLAMALRALAVLVIVGGGLIALFVILGSLGAAGAAQAIHVLLSIEGRARESAALQRAMLAQLRRIADGGAPTR